MGLKSVMVFWLSQPGTSKLLQVFDTWIDIMAQVGAVQPYHAVGENSPNLRKYSDLCGDV